MLLLHGALHGLLAWACLAFFARAPFLSIRNQLVIIGYAVMHLAIDGLKSFLIGRSVLPDNAGAFLLDQLLHGFVIAAAALLVSASRFAALADYLRVSPTAQSRILETAIIYA